MPKVVLHPFYSQQDKATQRHLPICGNVRQLVFLAEKLTELDWDVTAVAPVANQECVDAFPGRVHMCLVPMCNKLQRIHWHTHQLTRLYAGADMCITNHELMAIPVRACYPSIKIVQFAPVQPDLMFRIAWDASDLVVSYCEGGAREVDMWNIQSPTAVWRMSYDERKFQGRTPVDRDIDVLFISRCSSTNYTNHEKFLQAMPNLSHLRVVFMDPTGYLRLRDGGRYEYGEPDKFVDYLYRAKVAVALNWSVYGGFSLREAVRAGCVPVCMHSAYEDVCGTAWPCYVDSHCSPESVVLAVERAMKHTGPLPDVSKDSYQAAWSTVKEDLCSLASLDRTEWVRQRSSSR